MDPLAWMIVAWMFFGGKDRKDVREKIRELEEKLPPAKRRAPPPPPPRKRRRRRRRRAPPPPVKTKTITTTTRTTPTGKKTTTTTTTTKRRRKSNLMRRANQRRARDWVPDLRKQGVSGGLALKLARWIGIESSGQPLAISRIGERGLLQATKSSMRRIFTRAEREKMKSPATSRAEHARMAIKQYMYHKKRAARWVSNRPPSSDAASWVWYAKMHHTRPLDLRQGKVHGPALPMAKDLWMRARGDKRRRQRLAMANVSAFKKVYL